jgi:uncharacterized protein involved in exopolysaccharide biosynthesis
MTDILQRIVNMLGDCAIGPMRTLKTDDLTRVLYDAHEEIEHLRARETRLQKALQDIIDIYGENLPAGEIALAALREGKK